MTKTLKEKAISIKGKQYVLVSDRVIFFNEQHPKGSITTELVSGPKDEMVIVKATVRPDDSGRTFSAYSQATWNDGYINKTSAIENAETSAVGRALGFMGIGVLESIASADEIKKATASTGFRPKPKSDIALTERHAAELDMRPNEPDPTIDELNEALNNEH